MINGNKFPINASAFSVSQFSTAVSSQPRRSNDRRSAPTIDPNLSDRHRKRKARLANRAKLLHAFAETRVDDVVRHRVMGLRDKHSRRCCSCRSRKLVREYASLRCRITAG